MKAHAFILGYTYKQAAEDKDSPGLVEDTQTLNEDNEAALDQVVDGQQTAAVDSEGDKIVDKPTEGK